MNVAVALSSPLEGEIFFTFFACKSYALAEQCIEPAFYEQWHGSLHEGAHFEFEVCSESILMHELSLNDPSPLHLHRSLKNNKTYVCWTGPVPTFVYALEMLQAWCVGTLYTMESGLDFGKTLLSHDIKPHEFATVMKFFRERFDIKVLSIEQGD